MITKRQVAFGMAASAVGIAIRPVHGGEAALFDRLKGELARVEAESRGRLGVAMLDTRSNAHCDHRGDERFPMCSTFKLLAAAAVLARVDAGKEQLQRRIRFAPSDIVVNSPITQNRTGDDGMSLDELCEAAMIVSDNTAGNLLLDALGGPAGLTAFARSLGDSVTRLDRIEPDLNEALPDDPRDTTSPVAMLANLRGLVLGDVLSVQSRTRLTGWLVGNKTGDTRLRAGLPKGWRVGDKTGAGDHGTTNDVGVIWPGERQPVLVATYLTGTSASPAERNATLAAVGRAVAAALG
jgi:beta-lactamase class A